MWWEHGGGLWGAKDNPGEVGSGQVMQCLGEARTQEEVRVRGHCEAEFRSQFEAGLSAQALAGDSVRKLWPGSGL